MSRVVFQPIEGLHNKEILDVSDSPTGYGSRVQHMIEALQRIDPEKIKAIILSIAVLAPEEVQKQHEEQLAAARAAGSADTDVVEMQFMMVGASSNCRAVLQQTLVNGVQTLAQLESAAEEAKSAPQKH